MDSSYICARLTSQAQDLAEKVNKRHPKATGATADLVKRFEEECQSAVDKGREPGHTLGKYKVRLLRAGWDASAGDGSMGETREQQQIDADPSAKKV